MQEYWVNVYLNKSNGNRYYSTINNNVKPAYRIHVKMKPKPKYDETKFYNSMAKSRLAL